MEEQEGDYVELWPAGASGKGEFSCAACGHGAVVTQTLPPCPTCGEQFWERAAWTPFRRVVAAVNWGNPPGGGLA